VAAPEWIQPQHLEWAALEATRERFAAEPSRMVVLADFLLEPIATRMSRFLTDEAEFAVTVGLTTRYGACSEEEFDAAPAAERFFRYRRLTGARAVAGANEGLGALKALDRALAEPSLRALFQHISGMPLAGFASSVRRMEAGDFLVPHADDVDDRLLSFVIYLTPGWEPRHGGTLYLERGGGELARVEPRWNSIVIFDARTQHHIAPIEAGAPPRVTFGGWFTARRASPAPPRG
jgi:hypothetical protein